MKSTEIFNIQEINDIIVDYKEDLENYLCGLHILLKHDWSQKKNIHKLNMLEKNYSNINFIKKRYTHRIDDNIKKVFIEGDDKERKKFIEEMIELNMTFSLDIHTRYETNGKYKKIKRWILDMYNY